MKYKWIGDDDVPEEHRHDYRWIKDKEEREKWIKEHYKLKKEKKK